MATTKIIKIEIGGGEFIKENGKHTMEYPHFFMIKMDKYHASDLVHQIVNSLIEHKEIELTFSGSMEEFEEKE